MNILTKRERAVRDALRQRRSLDQFLDDGALIPGIECSRRADRKRGLRRILRARRANGWASGIRRIGRYWGRRWQSAVPSGQKTPISSGAVRPLGRRHGSPCFCAHEGLPRRDHHQDQTPCGRACGHVPRDDGVGVGAPLSPSRSRSSPWSRSYQRRRGHGNDHSIVKVKDARLMPTFLRI